MIETVHHRITRDDPDYAWLKDSRQCSSTDLVDYLWLFPADDHDPFESFPRLRWGGQMVYLSRDANDVKATAQAYRHHPGFVIEEEPKTARRGSWLRRMLGLGAKTHYFVARKTALLQPGESTDRFTFNVRLTREHVPTDDPRGYAVVKRVPSKEDLLQRLIDKHPKADRKILTERARKLSEKIFPIFLTREAAFLKLLQRDLPEALRNRVPHLLHMEQDETGKVRMLVMNWLRVGGQTLQQIEFARQGAALLHALHEQAGIIHLDLRLDNIVITPTGVSFVDFGSAVRVGEDISKNPMLDALFDEMMSTSQIQRLLGKMKSSGRITSHIICNAHGKVDKAVDLFYFAMQINKPHGNPDLATFIEYNPKSKQARLLSELTDNVMRPKDPQQPRYTSARDLLEGIEKVAESL